MILLFDVDGVLLENRAYRAGVGHVVNYFGQQLGFDGMAPSDADIDVFESQNIIVEWDTAAIIVSAMLLARLAAEAASPDGRERLARLPAQLWTALEALGPTPPGGEPLAGPDVVALARQIGPTVQTGERPSQAALRLMRAQAAATLGPSAPAARLGALLEQLLAQAYEIDHAPAMQVFQNVVLGDALYAHHYQLPPRLRGGPLLEVLDKPKLAPELAAGVLARRRAGALYAALYTARPSLAPLEAGTNLRGFTPEAEIARAQAKLEGVPVIGYGKVDWLGQRLGRSSATLVKPAPVHALAAIGAALSGQELPALEAALAVERGEAPPPLLAGCAGQTVVVFEDSTGGMRGAAEAVAVLNQHGLGVRLVRYGIAAETSPKRKPLVAVSDAVLPDINTALRAALGS